MFTYIFITKFVRVQLSHIIFIELLPICQGYVNGIPQSSALRVAQDGSAGHSAAKNSPSRPLTLEPYDAYLDLSHLSTLHRMMPVDTRSGKWANHKRMIVNVDFTGSIPGIIFPRGT